MQKSAVVAAMLYAVLPVVLPSVAAAQAPGYPPPPLMAPPPPAMAMPASPEASEIAGCLCLERRKNAVYADYSGRQQGFDRLRNELADVNSRLERERNYNVNDPEAVARFRALLNQRDQLFKRSTGPEFNDLSAVTARYNQAAGEYNARCANRPWNPNLVAQIQSSLACPGP